MSRPLAILSISVSLALGALAVVLTSGSARAQDTPTPKAVCYPIQRAVTTASTAPDVEKMINAHFAEGRTNIAVDGSAGVVCGW